MIYVPRTEFVHAARIGVEGSVSSPAVFRKARIVANAFQKCSGDPDHLRCLLCVAIPLRGVPSPQSAILCLSRGKPNKMGDLEFHAIKVAAALIGLAFLG